MRKHYTAALIMAAGVVQAAAAMILFQRLIKSVRKV